LHIFSAGVGIFLAGLLRPAILNPSVPGRDNRSRACRVWTSAGLQPPGICPLCHPGPG